MKKTMSTIREQLIELFYDNNVHCDQTIEHLVDDVVDIINNSSLVEKQQGRWLKITNGLQGWKCSLCDEHIYVEPPRNPQRYLYPYCPGCNAEMILTKGSDIDESFDKKNKA